MLEQNYGLASLATLARAPMSPQAVVLAQCFNQCFSERYQVHMQGGYAEPNYVPANSALGVKARLHYTRDYAASALHEIAHWCIAGPTRRSCEDFGYQYLAPPRSAEQQQQFFAGEVKVQALEALFAQATGVRFVVSADNLDASPAVVEDFAMRVEQLLDEYSAATGGTKLPRRAREYLLALAAAGLTPGVEAFGSESPQCDE